MTTDTLRTALRAAWAQGHRDGIGCGHDLAVCLHKDGDEEVDDLASWNDSVRAALAESGDDRLREAAAATRDLIANYLWNEDNSGDENDLEAAYDRLAGFLGTSTEEGVGQTLAAEYAAQPEPELRDLDAQLVLRAGHLPTCGEGAEFPWDCTCDYAGFMERMGRILAASKPADAGVDVERGVIDTLRVFANMASGTMFSRLRQKAHIWGVSWRTSLYTDAENIERLRRAVDHLVAAVDYARREDATPAEIGEPWKRAADVANQAFMLADQLRRYEPRAADLADTPRDGGES